MKFNIWSDYPKKPLPELLSFIVDNRGKSVPTSDTGKNVLIATNCIRNENLYPTYEKVRYFTDDVYNTWFRAHPLPGDVIFVNKGTPGRTCMVPNPHDFSIAQDMMAFRTNEAILHNRYLLCILRSHEIQEQIRLYSVGDVIPHFKKQFLNRLMIPIPPMKIQRCIADMYFCFSDKIENNKTINKNLEEQARAIFDRMISSSNSPYCTLSEIAELNPKRAISKGTVARCIDMAQLSTSTSFPNGWEYKPFNGGMRFCNGDTLLARITPCLENGKTAYINFLDNEEVAFGSTEYVVMSSKGEYPNEFFYCLARYPEFVDYAVKNMNGSSGRQRVSAETIGKYELPKLNDVDLQEFRNVVPQMFDVCCNNSLENIRLANMRDVLLPRLMSGEIDVSNIEL